MPRKQPYQSALIMSALAIGLGAITYFVIKPRRDGDEKRRDKASLLFGDLEREKISEFEIANASGTFHVKRRAEDNEQWLLVTDGKTYQADKSSVDGILSTLLSAKKESPLKGKSELAPIGLEPAKFKLDILTGATTSTRQLYVGEDTPVDYLVYAKWSDSNDVFLTTRSLRFSLDKKLTELRNKKVLPFKSADLARLDLKLAPQDKLPTRAFAFETDGDGWKTTATPASPSPNWARADKVNVDKLIDSLGLLIVTDFASELAADKPKYGFQRPLVTMTIKPKDAKTAPSMWLIAQAKDPKADPKTKPALKTYLTRTDQDSVYEISETFLDHFKHDFFHFRPKTVVSVAKAEVVSITVQDLQSDLSFKKSGGTWTMKGHVAKKDVAGTAKAEAIDHLLDAVTNLAAVEFLDGQSPAALGLSRPSRVVEIQTKGQDAPTTLYFGRRLSGDRVVVRTEDLDAAAAVALKLDEAVPLKAESYLDVAKPAAESTPAATTEGAHKVKLEPTAKSPKELTKLPAPIVKPGHKYSAEIEIARTGKKIVLSLNADKAPYTVSNFIHLARNHFYDGTKFHRVIRDFMAQGGDPTGTGAGGPGWKFDNEDNDLKHKRGAISMAHAGRNTNGSQFFIVFKPQPHLDGMHVVFGEVTQGLDVLDDVQQGDVMKKVEVFEEKL